MSDRAGGSARSSEWRGGSPGPGPGQTHTEKTDFSSCLGVGLRDEHSSSTRLRLYFVLALVFPLWVSDRSLVSPDDWKFEKSGRRGFLHSPIRHVWVMGKSLRALRTSDSPLRTRRLCGNKSFGATARSFIFIPLCLFGCSATNSRCNAEENSFLLVTRQCQEKTIAHKHL